MVAPAMEHFDRCVQFCNPVGINRHLTATCGRLNLVRRLLCVTDQADQTVMFSMWSRMLLAPFIHRVEMIEPVTQ